MVISMRDSYPSVFLCGDGGYAAEQFFRGIRFSSHCEYHCSGYNLFSEGFSFPHVKEAGQDWIDAAEISFFFQGDKYRIGERESPESWTKNNKTVLLKDPWPIDAGRNLSQIDYVRNADGSLEYVCSYTNEKVPVHEPLQFTELVDCSCTDLHECLSEAHSVTLFVNEASIASERCIELHTNLVSAAWQTYRSVGINIPLLLIQVRLGRKVSTYPMVDLSDLMMADNLCSYNLEAKKVFWFDLDETLICRGMPVVEIIQFLRWLSSAGKTVKLLTRHTSDISATLARIGMSACDFSEVVKVDIDQKKSSWVHASHVFIDNEYPQRIDVRKNSGAMVMDLDQVEFINY